MLATIRDVAIIILAAIGIIQLLVMLVLTISLYKKVGPVLESTKATMDNFRGTSAFMSDTMVRPLIKVASVAFGVRESLSTITRIMQRRGK